MTGTARIRRTSWALRLLAVAATGLGAVIAVALLALLVSVTRSPGCALPPGGGVVLGPPGAGQLVGATEYGGPGDPGSGTVGASAADLVAHPDSYAELGGYTFDSETDP